MMRKFWIMLLIFLPLYGVWVVAAGYVLFGLCTACLDPGPLQLLSIVGYLVVILIPIWPFIKWMTAAPSWVKKVEADGKPATATILSVKNTGIVINNTVAVVKLQLRVEPPNEAPFEVSLEKQFSMLTGLGGYSAGAHINVKYDPANKNHSVIISDPDGTSDYRAKPRSAVAQASNSGSDVTQKLAELSKLHKSGELSDSEFAAAKKKLLG
jgi:putative oligomerization/nucleic acid binding protein